MVWGCFFLFYFCFGGGCVAVQSNALTSGLSDLATTASNAVADLAGVQAGADVLASQFVDVKNAMQDLVDFANTMRNSGYYTPVGSIVSFAGAAAPDGWLLCNGVTIPNGSGTVQSQTSDFSVLYSVLAGAYGGAGKLPDLQGRTIIGVGTGAEITAVVGTLKGAATQTIGATNLPTHTHSWSTSSTGGHEHTYYRAFNANEQIPGSGASSYTVDASSRGYGGSITLNTGGGGAHSHSGTTGDGTGTFNATPLDNVQPSLPLYYIIKF